MTYTYFWEGFVISKICRRYVWVLVFRILLLASAICLYIVGAQKPDFTVIDKHGFGRLLNAVVWLSLVAGMLFRLFPNRRIAMGARKHYACSYGAVLHKEKGSNKTSAARKGLHKGAFFCGVAWVLFNSAIFFVLSMFGALTPSSAMLIMLAYSVFDIICILFFCPFQLLFMRNRCCVTCRIYNWDYLMMCTPLILFPSAFSVSLLLLSAAVVVRWEIALRRRPHYFIEETNEKLRCEKCEERFCRTQITSKGGRTK